MYIEHSLRENKTTSAMMIISMKSDQGHIKLNANAAWLFFNEIVSAIRRQTAVYSPV